MQSHEHKSFKEITDYISEGIKGLATEAPEAVQAFQKMGAVATKPGVLDVKTKKLLALAIAVSCRCDPCVGFHTQGLAKVGATKEEIAETLAVAVYMGGGPSMMYAAEAWHAFEEAEQAEK